MLCQYAPVANETGLENRVMAQIEPGIESGLLLLLPCDPPFV
jgi:hypothetical protein